MPKGLSSDSMSENTNMREDYTMGDLIRNSNAREASRAKEAELREQILFENQSKELKAKLEGWVESNNNALSYMYLFGKDFKDGKDYFEKHGMYYEHSAKDLESMRLRDYLSEYVTDEQKVELKNQYKSIMNAGKDDWQSRASIRQRGRTTKLSGLGVGVGSKSRDRLERRVAGLATDSEL